MFKKSVASLMILVLSLVFFACSNDTVIVTTQSVSNIYETSPQEAYPESEALSVHRAEEGYYMQSKQGYNGWYYESSSKIGEYKQMVFDNNQWSGNGALIYGPILSPSAKTMAVRTFTAPATGNVTIYGTYKMAQLSSDNVSIKIFVNDVQIYPETGESILNGNDLTGYYFNLKYSLKNGDNVRFVTSTEGESNPLVYWTPVVDYLNLPDDVIHFAMNDYVGDVHPYYYDGKLYMYYLALDGNFSSTLATSPDMINFTPQELTTTRLNAPGSNYYVLGVIKEGNYFRSFYGAGKDVGSSRSLDLLQWESGIEWNEQTYDKLYSPSSNFQAGIRDPYAFYDPDTNKYHIVATGYKANENYPWSNTTGYDSYIVLFTSTGPSLSEWEKNPVTQRPGYNVPLLHFGDWVHNIEIGDPECSQMFKIGDRWYILASMSGRGSDHGVGRPSYWVGDKDVGVLDMDWQANIENEYFLDGEDLCAAQVVQIGDKFYLFGWIPQKNYSYGWGGTVNVIREIYQKEDGTLGTRLESTLSELLNSGSLFRLYEDNSITQGIELTNGKYEIFNTESKYGYDAYASLQAEGTYGRTIINLDMSFNQNTEAGGIVVNGLDNNVEMGLRKIDGTWQIYLKNQGIVGKVSATNNIVLNNLEDIKITIILEGNIAEIFVNDEYALSARSSEDLSSKVSIQLFGSGLGTQFNKFEIDALTSAKDFGH